MQKLRKTLIILLSQVGCVGGSENKGEQIQRSQQTKIKLKIVPRTEEDKFRRTNKQTKKLDVKMVPRTEEDKFRRPNKLK